MGKFITLREEFESETGVHPFADQKYIEWLEAKVEELTLTIGDKPAQRFREGQKVKVIAKRNGHKFEIGETVFITFYNPEDGDYECSNGEYSWYLTYDELESISNAERM